MLNTTTEKTKRKQSHFSNKEYWEIAKFAIEHKCVIQDIHAYPDGKRPAFIPFTIWRVKKKMACEELYLNTEIECNEYHLGEAVKFYNEITEITQVIPNVPAIEDTVEMDILTATNKRLEGDLKEITNKYAQLDEQYKKMSQSCAGLMLNMREIAKHIPAECFGIKRK